MNPFFQTLLGNVSVPFTDLPGVLRVLQPPSSLALARTWAMPTT